MSISDNEPIPALTVFEPVALRARHDGWTPDRQIAFVEALADSACVAEAARRVGMSVQSAYALRRRPLAWHFREAWDAALDIAMLRLEQAALGRALNSVARPLFYRGEQVGEWREYDERLTMFLLRCRRPERFGAALDHLRPPPEPVAELAELADDNAARLDWHCRSMEDFDDDPADLDAGPGEEPA